VFPERFESIGQARAFMAEFVEGYNHSHRHTGIGLHTPADVHYGLAAVKAVERSATLALARKLNPERFSSSLDPKILTLPGTTWIHKPAEQQAGEKPTPKLAA